jgi:gamma-D-glutamyl-L-lysine dipeptidyl-peptidase
VTAAGEPLVCVVDAATVWTSPDAPRDIDAPALLDVPDMAAWTAALGAEERLDLHGRVDTQLSAEEPAVLLEERDGWAQVAAPWQPSPKDPLGYPGWVRRAHLASATSPRRSPEAVIAATAADLLDFARSFVGLHYLWGGTSSYGVDCSGLVHLAFRAAGIVVPRDASAQCAAAEQVDLGDEQPGDLYFFARPDGFIYHVGFVTAPGVMLHAPEGTALVEEAPISAERRRRLSGTGRLLLAG